MTAINQACNRFLRFGAACCFFLSTLAGCGASTQALVQCKLAALDKLPDDPLAVSGHDVSNLVARVQNCRDQPTADAGSP